MRKVLTNFLTKLLGVHEEYIVPIALTHINLVLYAFAYWATRPVLPFLSEELGANAQTFGLLQTFFNFVQLGGGPVVGRICDTYGSKIAIQTSQIASFLAYFLLWYSSSVEMLFVSQLPTLFMHLMQASQSLITSLSTTDVRVAALGKLSLSYAIGMILGSSFGGKLSLRIGNANVALVASAAMLVIIPVNALLLPSPKAAKKTDASQGSTGLHLKRIVDILRDSKELRQLMIFQLLFGLAASIYQNAFPMIAKNVFLLNAEQLGYLTSLGAVLGVVFNTFVVGWFTQKLSQKQVLLISASVLAFSMFSFAVITKWEHLVLLVVPMSFSGSILYTVVTAELSELVHIKDSGTAIGLGHANRSLCGIISPTIGGYLYQNYGHSYIGIVGGIMSAISAAFLIFGTSSKPKSKTKK